MDGVELPRWCDLTEPQRRVVTRLAEAELADPPAWVVMPIQMNTIRKLTNLDLMVVSYDKPRRAHITSRGMLYYRERLADGPPEHFGDVLQQIVKACLTGEAYYAVAEQFGCSDAYISQVMRGKFPAARRVLDEMGLKPRKVLARHGDQKRQQVLEMRRQGIGYADIRATTGIAHGTIGKWIKDAGMTTEGWLSDDDRRQIVRLVCDEGLTYEETAARIGRSMRPVRETMDAFYRGRLKV